MAIEAARGSCVELVTTGRINGSAISTIGSRFAAIGVYLGYTKVDDKTPSSPPKPRPARITASRSSAPPGGP